MKSWLGKPVSQSLMLKMGGSENRGFSEHSTKNDLGAVWCDSQPWFTNHGLKIQPIRSLEI